MFCKYCGEKIDSDSSFCQMCGKKLVENVGVKDSEIKIKKKSSAGEVKEVVLGKVGKIIVETVNDQSEGVQKVIKKKANKTLDGFLKKVGLKEKTLLDRFQDRIKKKTRK